jgi:hypothetical protein
MAGDGTLTGSLATPPAGYSKSIYYQVAPQGAAFPYVIFQKQSGTPFYAWSDLALDNELWLVKGVSQASADQDSADSADGIASRLDDLLTDGAISISGRDDRYLRRESDIDYSEVEDGVVYRHAGSLFRLIYA